LGMASSDPFYAVLATRCRLDEDEIVE
jgi:hypothetical protein